MNERSALYEALVWAFDASTGIITGTIPQMFGQQQVKIYPALFRNSDLPLIMPVASGERIMAFFPGNFDTEPYWVPRVLDQGFTAAIPPGRRNLFDNPHFKIHQTDPAGTTGIIFSANAGNKYTDADRWVLDWTTASTGCVVYGGYPIPNHVQSPSQAALLWRNYPGIVTIGPGDYLRICQWIAGDKLQALNWGNAAAKPLTVTYMISSTVAGTATVEAAITTGNYYCSRQIQVAAGAGLYSVTFPPFTASTPTSATNAALLITLWTGAGSTFSGGGSLNTAWTSNPASNTRAVGQTNFWTANGNVFDIFDTQAEPGSVFTGFEDTNYDDDLRRCMMFLQVLNLYKMVGVGAGGANPSATRLGAPLVVPMRAAPAVTFTGTVNVYDGWNAGVIGTISTNYSRANMVEIDCSTNLLANGSSVANVRPIITYVGNAWAIILDARI